VIVEFECPECQGHICERWGLNGSNLGIRLMYWHLILNPGLAFNELLLGQRTPAQMYVCKSCPTPLADRSYVYCANCDVFHNGRTWSYKQAFGNWLGYVCPSCGALIPCLWNLTSRLLLAMTAPIWWLPIKRYRARWIHRQYKRITAAKPAYLDKDSKSVKPIPYGKMGLLWALIMNACFAVVAVITAATTHAFGLGELVGVFLASMLAGLIIWLPAGWLFAGWMKLMLDKKGNQELHLTINTDGAIVHPESLAEIEKKEPQDQHSGPQVNSPKTDTQ
jgi:hypothetical protein